MKMKPNAGINRRAFNADTGKLSMKGELTGVRFNDLFDCAVIKSFFEPKDVRFRELLKSVTAPHVLRASKHCRTTITSLRVVVITIEVATNDFVLSVEFNHQFITFSVDILQPAVGS